LNRTNPETPFIPCIIQFLGYVPYTPACLPSETLKIWRESWGLNQEAMARTLQVDESTIASWERGDHKPVGKSLRKIKQAMVNAALPIKRGVTAP